MNPERKELWLAALESGEFEQGKRELRTSDGRYCCLGVACEVYRRETGDGSWLSDAFNSYDFKPGDGDSAWSSLPPAVAEWYGLPSHDPTVVGPNGREALAMLNDAGHSFAEIAGWIRGQL